MRERDFKLCHEERIDFLRLRNQDPIQCKFLVIFTVVSLNVCNACNNYINYATVNLIIEKLFFCNLSFIGLTLYRIFHNMKKLKKILLLFLVSKQYLVTILALSISAILYLF